MQLKISHRLAIGRRRRVPAVLLVYLRERLEGGLSARQRVRMVRLVAEVDARVALDERGRYLQYERLDAVGARPALLGQQLHAQGTAAQHVAAEQDRVDDAYKRRIERKIVLVTFNVEFKVCECEMRERDDVCVCVTHFEKNVEYDVILVRL